MSFGLAGFVVRAHPLFLTVKWAGIGYLAYLAASALHSAFRGNYPPVRHALEALTGTVLLGFCAKLPTES